MPVGPSLEVIQILQEFINRGIPMLAIAFLLLVSQKTNFYICWAIGIQIWKQFGQESTDFYIYCW